MNKAEEFYKNEFIKSKILNEIYTPSQWIFDLAEEYKNHCVNSISRENKNLQEAFDSMYQNCLRIIEKHEPGRLKKTLKEIKQILDNE